MDPVVTGMNVAEIIADKRDGKILETERIHALIAGYARNQVPDYQMAAFAMAVYFQGMNTDETVALTRAMLESGRIMNWSNDRIRADKHSTGGVGDKVSIALAPLLAAADVDVPMISGRGLGTTGGTLDKLESIRGFRCELSNDELRYVVNRCGCAIVGASEDLAVADRKLYALRDVTGTVPSIPLITASILSKKLAAGLDALVLDVKCGNGAFMTSVDKARDLAWSLVQVANQFKVRTTALITDMNQPLGRMVGNSNEISEAIDVLKCDGPQDVTELTLALGSEVLVSAGKDDKIESARNRLETHLKHGDALQKFNEFVESQEGDLSADRPVGSVTPIRAAESGFIQRISSDRLGLAIIEMGGGRKKMGDRIDHSVGIEVLVTIGESVEAGQTIANVYCDDASVELAAKLVELSFGISPVPCDSLPLIIERVSID